RRWPVPTAERAAPAGPLTSTTRRPARKRFKVREASSSICAHAPSETGASARCRLSMPGVSFEGTNTERAVLRRCRAGNGGGRLVRRDVFEERRRRNEEQITGHGSTEIEDPVVIAGRPADEHVFQHRFDGARRAAVSDIIGAVFARPGMAEYHVAA